MHVRIIIIIHFHTLLSPRRVLTRQAQVSFIYELRIQARVGRPNPVMSRVNDSGTSKKK